MTTFSTHLQCKHAAPLSYSSVQDGALPRRPDIVALGCAKGLLHDWIWADNPLQECGGTLWRNILILFLPSLTIKRLLQMRRQNAANGSLLKLCVVLCYGMRLQHFELDFYSDVTVLPPVHVWLRPNSNCPNARADHHDTLGSSSKLLINWELFMIVTSLWSQCILNLWKIRISPVTKLRIWTRIHILDPSSWKTACRNT